MGLNQAYLSGIPPRLWSMSEPRPARPHVKLLITDLDNTLWDWFDAWYRSFSAMLRKLEGDSGVPRAELEHEIQVVHRLRGTAEYSYLLNELPSLLDIAGDREPMELFDAALHVLNSTRLRATSLYVGVESTLRAIWARDVPIVAYSESLAYWTEWRIRKTGLDGLIDVLYTSPDHDFPAGVSASDIRTLPDEEYGLKRTEHRRVPVGIRKPDPSIVKQIVSDYAVDVADVAYVGDSLMKDIAMAQDVGVLDVHAAYGVAQDRHGYELLRRVSHWSDADIEHERRIATRTEVYPSYQLQSGFSELLQLFDFAGRGR